MRVMHFAPHPDDDVIGCGGSIAKHIKKGNSVAVVYMTSGDAGSLYYSKEELAKIREREARAAANVFGVTDLTFLGKPDGYLEYNRENLIEVVELIRDKRPQLVYVPHENDGHADHKATNKIVVESIGRAVAPCFQECKGSPWNVKKVLAYEVWTPLQSFSYIEDITDFMEIKLKSLQQHKSQFRNYQFDEGVEGLNRFRGVMSGKGNYCECFQVLKTDKLF